MLKGKGASWKNSRSSVFASSFTFTRFLEEGAGGAMLELWLVISGSWSRARDISGNQLGSLHEPPTVPPTGETSGVEIIEHFIFVVAGMSDLVWVRISPPPNFWRYIKFCFPIYNSVRFFP